MTPKPPHTPQEIGKEIDRGIGISPLDPRWFDRAVTLLTAYREAAAERDETNKEFWGEKLRAESCASKLNEAESRLAEVAAERAMWQDRAERNWRSIERERLNLARASEIIKNKDSVVDASVRMDRTWNSEGECGNCDSAILRRALIEYLHGEALSLRLEGDKKA